VLLGEPQRTQADLNFTLFKFPVRVSPFFWLAGVVLGWNWAMTDSGVNGKLLLIWVSAVFVSILLHELGHAFAFRYFGTSAHVVLYHFGGLAVPDSYSSPWGDKRSRNPLSHAIISAAGPAVQLVVVGIIVVGLYVAGHQMQFWMPFVSQWIPFAPQPIVLGNGEHIKNDLLRETIGCLLYINFFWAVLNLLPVYPLDGGQIARELFLFFDVRDAIRNSLILSMVAAGGIAVYALTEKRTFLAVMFGLLAYSSYTALTAHTGGGGYGGRRP
jgi:stage IV sporulation protein FB